MSEIEDKVLTPLNKVHVAKQYLQTFQSDGQWQSQLSFLLAFLVREIEKVFDVEEFLDQFDISNSNLRKVRSYLLQTFVLAQDSKLIQNEFVLVLKTNKVKTLTKLTTNLISRTKLIYFKELTKWYLNKMEKSVTKVDVVY